jgi:hypothetical protein
MRGENEREAGQLDRSDAGVPLQGAIEEVERRACYGLKMVLELEALEVRAGLQHVGRLVNDLELERVWVHYSRLAVVLFLAFLRAILGLLSCPSSSGTILEMNPREQLVLESSERLP